jgi:translation elongation factor EF-Ts
MKKAVSEINGALGAAMTQIRSLEEWRRGGGGAAGGAGMTAAEGMWHQRATEQQRAVFRQYDSGSVGGLQIPDVKR